MMGLGLCWGTVPRAPLLTHIDAAADAGFTSISVSPEQYLSAHRSPAELRLRLADCGVVVDAVDPALTWLPGMPPTPDGGLLSYDTADVLTTAEALGARWINAAVAFPGPWSQAEITDAFAALCRRGAEAGVGVLLEFVPWSTVGDLPAAARVVRACGAANAGVTFDTWHFHRGGSRLASLTAEDLSVVRAIQISDAVAQPTTDSMTESISARLLPGEGVIPLLELLSLLREATAEAPLSVEVFNTDLRRQPVDTVARLAGDAARRVIAASAI
ncbi:MAG TPA: sugar phosphate isomerase/epimerase [Mycobacteriales bacterium]|nr:sugar phosphate isomerase/epimerase [Mycobacteriales bacterium]